MRKLVLASQSPRRHELMKLAGFTFECLVEATDEIFDTQVTHEKALIKIAREKALAVQSLEKEAVIISADTLVICDNRIMGKAKTEAEAKEMLEFLSGKTHEVITGVCILDGDHEESFTSTTHVTFYPLSSQFIDEYVASKQAYDKAGAYGIQDQGALMIHSIQGDYYTVMGLPIAELTRRLKNYNVK